MATFTLLQITQNILSRLDSDTVNSINDTPEALQVANIIQNKYYDILARQGVPAQEVLFQLTASGDTTKPTLMYVPSGTTKIDWIKYFDSDPNDSQTVSQFGSYSHGVNTDITPTQTWTTSSSTSVTIGTGTKTFTVVSSSLPVSVGQGCMMISGINSMFGTVTSYIGTTLVVNVTSFAGSGTLSSWVITSSPGESIPGYKYVKILPIDQFLDWVNRFNPSDSDVLSWTFTEGSYNFNLYYKNDFFPSYCAILENHYVLFDSYQNAFDDTLQSSKSMVYGEQLSSFSLTDNFVPDLDDAQFPLLINEATSLAFWELKQTPHPKAEQEIKRQWSRIQANKSLANRPSYFDQLANMGRVPRTGGYSSGGYGAYKWMRQSGP